MLKLDYDLMNIEDVIKSILHFKKELGALSYDISNNKTRSLILDTLEQLYIKVNKLINQDKITKDNIYLYYEFLGKEDLRQMIIKFENEYSNKIDNEIMDIIDILENRLQVL